MKLSTTQDQPAWQTEAGASERAERWTQAVRSGEQNQLWYRCERIFKWDEGWYFHTREGVDVGPYRTQFDAEIEAGLLIQVLSQTESENVRKVINAHLMNNTGDGGNLNTAFYTDYLVETGGVELLKG